MQPLALILIEFGKADHASVIITFIYFFLLQLLQESKEEKGGERKTERGRGGKWAKINCDISLLPVDDK